MISIGWMTRWKNPNSRPTCSRLREAVSSCQAPRSENRPFWAIDSKNGTSFASPGTWTGSFRDDILGRGESKFLHGGCKAAADLAGPLPSVRMKCVMSRSGFKPLKHSKHVPWAIPLRSGIAVEMCPTEEERKTGDGPKIEGRSSERNAHHLSLALREPSEASRLTSAPWVG